MFIQFLSHNAIDKARWDAAIDSSLNGLIYAKAFYLDYMTGGQWQALVSENYEYVMPVTIKRKWGIWYLAQPPFCQQLGIFSAAPITSEIANEFIELLTQRFRFAEIFMNYGNPKPSLAIRNNFVLPLKATYPQIYAGYQSNFVKNVKRANNQSLVYQVSTNATELLNLYVALYAERTPHVTQTDYSNFLLVCTHCQQQGELVLRTVQQNGNTLATAIFLHQRNRLYNMASSVTQAGRLARANYFLFDNLIREFSETQTLLDLEGSDVEGIAQFYQSMGAVNEPYYFLRYNHLPFPLRLVKR